MCVAVRDPNLCVQVEHRVVSLQSFLRCQQFKINSVVFGFSSSVADEKATVQDILSL